MKLIVQIPCYNEEKTLPRTVKDIPRDIAGIDKVEILIIDDGSTDRTVEVAKSIGVDLIVYNRRNKGLAFSFMAGLDACLKAGADIIVNTDGDNQYQGSSIPDLIAPILAKEADIVVGDRKTSSIDHFSLGKKLLQRLGSWIVRRLSDTMVPDAVSGFRAFSRDAAMQLNIVSEYSYTVETVIQAGKKKLNILSIPVDTNPKTRESRLAKSIPKFIMNQLNTMIRMYTMFKPLKVFFFIGGFCMLLGLIPSIRFLYFYLDGEGAGHIQSLIFASIFFIIGFQGFILGLISDVISFNRKLIEETLLRVRRIELNQLDDNKER
ncbi:MAG: glycosyltransferase family 2 protein [Dissulfuribacterales bacterium]